MQGLPILDEQGKGVLTQVFMARQDALGRKVAVKFLDRQWVGSKAIVSRFQRQTRQQSRLHHHGIASGIDVGTVDSVPYFVVEYLEGDTLGARVRSAMTFEVAAALHVLKELLEVVGWVHGQDQVVGSMHPEAVVLGDAGEVWLTGLGFPLPSPRSYPDTHAHELLYLAPEGVAEPEDAGKRGDVFSVGAVAVFLFTGRAPRPSSATTSDALARAKEPPAADVLDGRKLPEPLKEWVLRLLSADPGDRPADATAALRELEAVEGEILQGQATLARSAMAAEQRSGDGVVSFRRSKRFIWFNRGLTVALAVAVNVFVFNWIWGQDDEEKTDPGNGQSEVSQARGDAASPVDDAEAQRRYEGASTLINQLMATDRFSDAFVNADAFAADFTDSEVWGPKGLKLLEDVRKGHADRATELLDVLEALIKRGKLDEAREALRRARPIAADVASKRVKHLEDRLHDARIARRQAGAGKPETGKPETGKPETGKPETGKPEGRPASGGEEPMALSKWGKLVERALSRPSEHDLRKELLERAAKLEDPGQLGDLAPRIRWLGAVDAAMTDLTEAWKAGVGKPIELPMTKGEAVAGVLVSVEKDKLVLKVEAANVEVSLDRVAPRAMLRMLSVLTPSLDRYLARARLAVAARAGEDAWFDLQGALLLAGDDAPARALAEAELERLSRLPPRPRRK
ncbi:MAG: hypothetical protein HRU14_16165 [Planctomycetes bacterium]|nr:hypothetical protein [Planctomycetota bacterium]